jgi:tRNA A58 N-methylase Trm61
MYVRMNQYAPEKLVFKLQLQFLEGFMRMVDENIDWRLVLAAPYAPTPEDDVETALKLASLKKGELLYDLGCGDGRVIITAAKDFGSPAIGFEIQDELIDEASRKIHEAGLDNVISVFKRDFFHENLSNADVVFLYLTPSILGPVSDKLGKELKHGSRVIAYRYPVKEWIPTISVLTQSAHGIFLYLLPCERTIKNV